QFEAVFGVTPHQFRIASRIELAKGLLAGDEYWGTHVCMEGGFSSLGSFSPLFAQRVGESPSTYRRRIRTLVSVPGHRAIHLTPGCLSLMGALPPSAFRSV